MSAASTVRVVDPVAGARLRHERSDREHSTVRLLRAAQEERCPRARQGLRERAALLNRDLALGVANRYHGRGMEPDDIDQVALLGLWKAVLRYEPRMEATFAAYAIPTIVGEVKRHFRDHGWAVRPPRALQEQTTGVARAADVLRAALAHEPTVAELCGYLGTTERELTAAVVAGQAYRARSLDLPLPGTDIALGECLADPADAYARADLLMTLRQALTRLSERDRLVLRLRYEEGLTQQEIGSRIAVSQMQVSRILQRIHAELEVALTDAEGAGRPVLA